MLAPAHVHAILRSSRGPLGTGAIALTLGVHWAPVAELLVALERKGEVVWQGHGWVPAPGTAAQAASDADPGAYAQEQADARFPANAAAAL